MKKIAYFSSSRLGSRDANALQVCKMCSALSKRGVEVVLFHRKEDKSVCYIEIAKRFSLSGPPFKTIAINDSSRFFSTLVYGFQCALKALRLGCQVGLGRDEASCFFWSIFRKQVIYEAHNVRPRGSKLRRVLTLLLRRQQLIKVIAITKALKDDLLSEFSLSNGRIEVLPDGADKIIGHLKGRKSNVREFSAGYVGHLFPGKGLEIILPLSQICNTVNFNVVGDDSKIPQKTREKFGGNVIFHGYKEQPEVEYLTDSFDVALLPNQHVVESVGGQDIGRWTSPMKLFQYMAHGKPIIASDLPVLKEILRDDENAILCPADDPEAWARALKRLRTEPELASRLAGCARAELESRYTWESRARVILDLFNIDS